MLITAFAIVHYSRIVIYSREKANPTCPHIGRIKRKKILKSESMCANLNCIAIFYGSFYKRKLYNIVQGMPSIINYMSVLWK